MNKRKNSMHEAISLQEDGFMTTIKEDVLPQTAEEMLPVALKGFVLW